MISFLDTLQQPASATLKPAKTAGQLNLPANMPLNAPKTNTNILSLAGTPTSNLKSTTPVKIAGPNIPAASKAPNIAERGLGMAGNIAANTAIDITNAVKSPIKDLSAYARIQLNPQVKTQLDTINKSKLSIDEKIKQGQVLMQKYGGETQAQQDSAQGGSEFVMAGTKPGGFQPELGAVKGNVGFLTKQAVNESKPAIKATANALKNEKGFIGVKPVPKPKVAQPTTQTAVSRAERIIAESKGAGLVDNTLKSTKATNDTQSYLRSLVQDQKAASKVDGGGIIQKIKSVAFDVKRKLVDSAAPIEDTLGKAQKQGKYKVLPSQDVHYQIDRALRSYELAGAFAKDNGMADVIKQAPDIHALEQYLIAKHAPEVASAGFNTGRNAAMDAKLVSDLAPVYEPFAQKVVKYGQRLLDKAVESGLVSKETAVMLKKKYPNYVPLDRIFNTLEQAQKIEGVGVNGVASLSKQTIVRGLKGSDRTIKNPLETLLTKTLDVFSQGERNIAGKMLSSYKDLPGNPFQLRELKVGETAMHTISYLENGVKKTFETTPEIAQAAKFLDKRQLDLIGQIFALLVRVARVGITGINIPFLGANIAKDQVSAFINSSHALQTSIINPVNFLKSLWTAIGHGKAYDEWIRSAAGGTSFDISRSAPSISIAKIRSTRNLGSTVAYTITHPADLLRTVENIVNRGEELTRIQQFQGTEKALLGKGRTAQDAKILAAAASRENTVNFARSGDWGKALNSVFLYLNAGIQGSRTLLRNLQTKPIQTASKIVISTFIPLTTLTAWNLGSPDRKAAYDDIRTSEKDGNLILVPPNPKKDPITGKWNVIKIPLSQEIANLTVPIRMGLESLHGADAPGFADLAKALIGTGTSLNVQGDNPLLSLTGQFTPQAIKPELEASLNKNIFSGADIVPQYLGGHVSRNLPPEQQVYPNTSGTARIAGRALNISPIKAEQFVKSTIGGVGSQVLNTSDKALAALGIIPKSQIGGKSILEGIVARFQQAAGGQLKANQYKNKKKGAVSIGTTIYR